MPPVHTGSRAGMTILVAEGEERIAIDTARALRSHGHAVLGPVDNGEAALALARENVPDLVLMGICLKGDGDGISTAGKIKVLHDIPVVLSTSTSDRATMDRARAANPDAIVFKPINENELQATLGLAVQRHASQRLLQGSEQRFRNLFENNIAGVFRATPDAEILDHNPAFARMLGFQVGERLAKRSLREYFDPKGIEEILARDAHSRERIARRELSLRREDGTQAWVIVNLAFDDDDSVIGTVIDITDRKSLQQELEKSLRLEQTLMETIPVPVYFRDQAGVYRDCNQAFLEFIDRRREEVVGRSIEEVFPAAMAATFRNSDRKILTTGKPDDYETVTTDGKGRNRPVHTHKALVTGDDRRILGIIGVLFDLSERKSMEHELRESREQLLSILDSAQDAIMLMDGDGVVNLWNAAGTRILGYTAWEMEGRSLQQIIALPRSRKRPEAVLELLRSAGAGVPGTGPTDVIGIRKNGEEVALELSLSSFEHRGARRVVGILRDFSERKAREQALRESEARFRLISESVQELILLVTPEGLVTYASPSIRRFGHTSEAHAGIPAIDLLHPEDCAAFTEKVRELATTHRSTTLVCRFKDQSRGWRTLELSMGLLVEDERWHILVVGRDITDRLAGEERLRILQQAIDQAPLAVMITDPAGTISYVNPAFTSNSGFDVHEAIGKTPTFLSSGMSTPETVARVWEAIRVSRTWSGTIRNVRKDGTEYYEQSLVSPVVSEQGVLQHFIAFNRDITQQVRMEEERSELEQKLRARNNELEDALKLLRHTQDGLVQSEKLASIGQLTAGIAHEINNPLAFVSSNLNRFGEYFEDVLSLLKSWRDLAPSLAGIPAAAAESARIEAEAKRLDLDFVIEDFQRLLNHTRHGTSRIKSIVDQLRGFTHLSGSAYSETDINEALEETVTILWNEIKYKATMVREFGAIPRVTCNPGEIKQVLVNLVVNAAHAIDQKGTITLRTTTSDQHVSIEVEDTGRGNPPENVKKVFDPFFTTKPVGKGTGLGLWICDTIIRKHSGTLAVRSEVGKGTVFTVRLPVQQPEPSQPAGMAQKPEDR